MVSIESIPVGTSLLAPDVQTLEYKYFCQMIESDYILKIPVNRLHVRLCLFQS